MNARGLRRLLEGLLLAEASACYQTSAHQDSVITPVTPAMLATAREGRDGMLGSGACDAICGPNDGCYAATFDVQFAPAITCQVRTRSGAARDAYLPISSPPSVASPDPATCAALCAPLLERTGDTAIGCRIDGAIPIPRPGERFVVCERHVQGETRTEFLEHWPPSGRRPAGLTAPHADSSTELGAYFAKVAYLERASVIAFTRLQCELAALSAPARLVRRARRAANDERRHGRAITRLAIRHGARVETPTAVAASPRSVFELAVENALEGCIGESLGALVCLRQSRAALRPSYRETMRAIARDELAHAALAWSVHRFCIARLTVAERRGLTRRVHAAAIERSRDVPPLTDKSCDELGLPRPVVARHVARVATDALVECLG